MISVSLEEFVKAEGFTVATVDSLRTAQIQLTRATPDVILTDLVLPDGEGIQLLAELESRDSTEVVVITGHASVESAIGALRAGATSAVYNCGYGRGLSVREVVQGVERVTGRSLPVVEGPRRPGDPPTLISDPSRIKAALGWKPAHDDLDGIIRSAIAWERRFNA